MPGPIVVATTQLLTYWPLAAAGFAFTIAPSSVSKFCWSFSTPKETLPIGQWMMLVLSSLYSILPALASVTARATSGVTVPAYGFGIRPRGPRILPRRPTMPIMSGEAMTTSNSMKFSFWIRSIKSSPPTISAPASMAA